MDFDEQNSGGPDLNAIFDRFSSPTTPIFKDRDVLLSSFVPQILPHRNKEIRDLANVLGPIMRGETPNNAFLYGKPGSGKTVVTKYVLDFLKEKAAEASVDYDVVYINCQHVDTEYRLWANLATTRTDDSSKIPSTGLPTQDVYEIFRTAVDKNNAKLTIVLDEIDLLVRKAGDSLYTLTRINTELNSPKISLIGITNDVSFKESLSARVKSTLAQQELVFPPYSADQLIDILQARTMKGFVENVVDSSAIAIASALAASEHGDARRALDLLRVAGEICERQGDVKVIDQHVKKASSEIEKNVVNEVLIGLPIHSKLVLLAIVALDILKGKNKKNDDNMITTGQIYSKYMEYCSNTASKELTQRRVGDLINELDLLGLIRANVISKGRYGRTRVIDLAVQRIEILHVLEKEPRIVDVLPEKKIW